MNQHVAHRASDPCLAPFTPDQVANLDRYQREGRRHPFTCPYRDDGKHRDGGGAFGALVPTVHGWLCPYCDYTQNWAYAFMCEPVHRVGKYFADYSPLTPDEIAGARLRARGCATASPSAR